MLRNLGAGLLESDKDIVSPVTGNPFTLVSSAARQAVDVPREYILLHVHFPPVQD